VSLPPAWHPCPGVTRESPEDFTARSPVLLFHGSPIWVGRKRRATIL